MIIERENLIRRIEYLTEKINEELDNQPDITDEDMFSDDDLAEVVVHNSALFAAVAARNYALKKLISSHKDCEKTNDEAENE